MRPRSFCTTLAALALLIAAAPCAEAREWRISLGGHSTRIVDEGVLATSGSGWLAGADIGFQVELGHDVLVGAAFATSSSRPNEPDPFQRYATDIFLFDLLATGRWNIEVLKWLRPFVEVGAGASRTRVDIDGTALGGSEWAFALSGRAGVELRLPPGLVLGGDFSLGLDLSGGYVWRTTFGFDDVEGIDLGDLDLHGGLYRIGLSVMW